MGGKWQVQGVQKDGQGIAGYWRNGWPRNGVLEDMATHWGVAVMALEVQLWAQVVPGGTLRTGGDAG